MNGNKLTLLSRQFVFDEGKYFGSCHASTVVKLDDENVMIACFGGTREGDKDVKIWLTSSDGDKFKEPIKFSYDDNIPHWNPVLFRGGSGKLDDEIILYFKVSNKISNWKTMYTVSNNNGISWSEIRELVPNDHSGGRGPVKNKPLRLSDGTWIAPRSLEPATAWFTELDRSVDRGRTWQTLHPITYKINDNIINGLQNIKTNGIIQPSLWEQPDGHVHMVTRSTWGKIYRSDSDDYGITWSPAYETELPNNNSGIDLDKTIDGTLVLCYNNVSANWGKRTPLNLAYSTDNGQTFINDLVLESEDGEFSYPSILADGNVLHVVYTWNRRNIVYAKVLCTP
jgi:Predicted neuraminidase (sialidase)